MAVLHPQSPYDRLQSLLLLVAVRPSPTSPQKGPPAGAPVEARAAFLCALMGSPVDAGTALTALVVMRIKMSLQQELRMVSGMDGSAPMTPL